MDTLFSKRVSRRFSTTVAGGDTDQLTKDVENDATIEEIRVRFYPGPLLDLELRPFVETQEGRRHDIVDLVGRETIVGNDDVFRFDVSEPVRDSDKVGVEFTNNDPDNPYDFVVDMTLEEAGGQNRVVQALMEAL